MMNPLSRKMFRKPGDSRQASGILASSPELANVVQQRQPLRMQEGGSATYMAAIQSLAQQGDVSTLMEIVRGNAPRDVKIAAQEAVNALSSRKQPTQISTSDTVAAPGGNTVSLTSPPVMSVRGSGDTVALKAAPPMMSYDGPSQGALERRAALKDAPSKIMEGLKSGIANIKTGFTDAIAPKGPVSKPISSPAEIRADINSFIGNKILGPKLQGAFFAEDIKDFEPNVDVTNPFDDPSDFDLSRDAFGFEEAGSDVNLGVTTTPVGPGETVASSAITSGGKPTPTQDAAKQDAEKTNGDTSSAFKPLMSKVDIDALTTGSFDTPQKSEQALVTGNAVIDQALKILQGSSGPKSDKAKAKALDETIGITGTYKERVEKRKTVLQDLLGERAKDIRTDANYNLMMTGLMIAAGESPDAMTNLAKGLAAGLKNYGDAAGEEAQAITKEDRALTIQAASEVGVEISEEKAAKIKAVENQITRDHESRMQDVRLATAIVQTGMQTDSAQQIALARIASTEQLAANSFGQNLAILGLQQDQQNKVLEKKQEFDKELLDIKANQESDTFKLMKKFQDSAAAAGKEMTDAEAYVAVKLAEQTSEKATDTTLSYRRLTSAGMPMMDAWLLSQSGAVSAMIKDMGSEEFEAFLQTKLAAGGGKTTFTVGQVVEQGGKKFRVTGVNDQGQPTSTEEVK